MEADEERDLVRRCQDGSEAAFAELVKTFEPLVWGAIWRTTGDRARGEDLAQEVFLRIYRGIRRFRGDSRLSTWIFRIVINVCAETRGMSEKTLEAQFDDLPADRKESFAMRDRAFADLELRDRVEKALAQLPAQLRFLVTTHYLGGRKYEELAEALQMPVGTVKTLLFRARRRLRELLEAELA